MLNIIRRTEITYLINLRCYLAGNSQTAPTIFFKLSGYGFFMDFIKNPQTTIALTFSTHINSGIDGVAKINFKIDFWRLKIQFVETWYLQLDFSNIKYRSTGGFIVEKQVYDISCRFSEILRLFSLADQHPVFSAIAKTLKLLI